MSHLQKDDLVDIVNKVSALHLAQHVVLWMKKYSTSKTQIGKFDINQAIKSQNNVFNSKFDIITKKQIAVQPFQIIENRNMV